MPSIHAQYNEEIVQAHREALAALRELLAQETDPLERRRLAIAILRARPVKEPAPEKNDEQTTVLSSHNAKNIDAPDHDARTPRTPNPDAENAQVPAPPNPRQPGRTPQTVGAVPETAGAS
jgi:hypothetical protein